ncbi:MAG: hypothetical protein RR060_05795, partial [Victivallaceae bacterium]
ELYYRAEENAAKLAAYLLERYDLPMSALKFHQDWSGKFCPHRILSENRRVSFTEKVEQYRKKVKLKQAVAGENSLATTAIWLDLRGGKMVYATSYGLESNSLAELIADLRQKKIDAADFSCWIKQRRTQNMQIINQLEQGGIKVKSFYAYPEQINSEYEREDLIQTRTVAK